MIYNDEFIWLHFPKCAGTTIEHLFRKYYSDLKEVHQDIVDARIDPDISWHHSADERARHDKSFRLNDRALICPFRKLPDWLVSRYNFECARNPAGVQHNPQLLLRGQVFLPNGAIRFADDVAERYLPKHILDYRHLEIMRTECFEHDFKRIFGQYIDLSRIPEYEYQVKNNASLNFLPDEIRHELYNSRAVYGRCPYWASLEERIYQE